MSGRFAEFVETEVLPQVAKRYNVKLTRDPDGRAAMGCSSGAAAAFSMAWFQRSLPPRGHLFRHVCEPAMALRSGDAGRRLGVPRVYPPNSPVKPIRIWMHVGDRDNYSENQSCMPSLSL